MREGWFALVASCVLVAMLAGVAVAVTEDPDNEMALEQPLQPPAVHDAEPTQATGTATLHGETYDSLQSAVDAAEPGDTILVEGVFTERIRIDTPQLTLRGVDGAESAVIDGGGTDTVIAIHADDVTVEDVWIRESGYERGSEDAGIFVAGNATTISDVRITEVTFGIWIHGVPDVTIEESTIIGRTGVDTLAERGNGIHLWEADGATVSDNHITNVRDGIYFAWAEQVVAERNVMWELRYGVHYMYSSDNRLSENVAFDNDVGFALMISQNLTIEENIAANNRGASGHGILIKDIDRSQIRDNHVVDNRIGLYVYNAQDNTITDNLVMANDRGMQVTAGTQGERVTGNSFIDNHVAAFVDTRSQVNWNDSERGNYWSDARPIDLTGDGTSEVRHQPAGSIEHLVHERPQAGVFAHSPAFDVIRLAESSFPVLSDPGAVDHHPLVEPRHDPREYHEHSD